MQIEEREPDSTNVTLECIKAPAVDINALPRWQKCLARRVAVDSPWLIGPEQQPQTFARLLPPCEAFDKKAFFELSWHPPSLYLQSKSDAPVLVAGCPMPRIQGSSWSPPIGLPQGAELRLCSSTDGRDVVFRVFRDMSAPKSAPAKAMVSIASIETPQISEDSTRDWSASGGTPRFSPSQERREVIARQGASKNTSFLARIGCDCGIGSKGVLGKSEEVVQSMRGKDESIGFAQYSGSLGEVPFSQYPDVYAPADAVASSINVVVECVHALGVDISRVPRWQRTLAKQISDREEWVIGESRQPQTFRHLVLEDNSDPSRACLFELIWDPPCLYIRRLALGMSLLVDGISERQHYVALLSRDALVSFCRAGDGDAAPRFIFRILRDLASEQAGIDAWLFQKSSDNRAASPPPQFRAFKDVQDEDVFRL